MDKFWGEVSTNMTKSRETMQSFERSYTYNSTVSLKVWGNQVWLGEKVNKCKHFFNPGFLWLPLLELCFLESN